MTPKVRYQSLVKPDPRCLINWPVEVAAFTSPRLKLSLSRDFMKIFLAPPVTDTMSLGCGSFQKSMSRVHIVSIEVSDEILTYCAGSWGHGGWMGSWKVVSVYKTSSGCLQRVKISIDISVTMSVIKYVTISVTICFAV